ncbi:radical SAM protein, partial [Thermoproteota archaeon]
HELIRFLRKHTNAFIGAGGIMPTLTPQHVMEHLPELNFIIRGAGEEVLPKFVHLLNAKNISSNLSKNTLSDLNRLKGLIFRNRKYYLDNSSHINSPKNFDNSKLNFSFVTKRDVVDGMNYFTSLGCFNRCLFCTNPVRGNFLAKSPKHIKQILAAYHLRLRQLFGKNIPGPALSLTFYDDDFLADDRRAVEIFRHIRNSPFTINLIQTGINSFFKRKGNRLTKSLNYKLLNSLEPSLFTPNKESNIYIGLENMSYAELKRLGKGYDTKSAKIVIDALAMKGLKVSYHFIASNQLTTPDNVLDNLLQFSLLQLRYGSSFKVLTPIIPYLISLFPSKSYEICRKSRRLQFLEIDRILTKRNKPKLNYPLIKNDIPIDPIVRKIIPLLYALFLRESNYLRIFDEVLVFLLYLDKKKRFKSPKLSKIITSYKIQLEAILCDQNNANYFKRTNIQLMMTKRCHLRCSYCPIVKGNQDIKKKTLFEAIDLLFTSREKKLRLDFTGGEPLLKFDLVKEGTLYAKKLARKINKKISFYLVTNLIELTDEMADFFEKEKFFLELSIDGEKKDHNKFKKGNDPKIDPYNLTTGQLEKVLSRNINYCAVMVSNPNSAKKLCSNFLHLLKKLNLRKISINYALCSYWNTPQRVNFFNQLDLIAKTYGNLFRNKIVRLNNFESRSEPAILNSEIMIDVNGDIRLLTDWFFEKSRKAYIPRIGTTKTIKSINSIPVSRFLALYRLFTYNRAKNLSRIIINNFEMGQIAKRFCEKWKRELNL